MARRAAATATQALATTQQQMQRGYQSVWTGQTTLLLVALQALAGGAARGWEGRGGEGATLLFVFIVISGRGIL